MVSVLVFQIFDRSKISRYQRSRRNHGFRPWAPVFCISRIIITNLLVATRARRPGDGCLTEAAFRRVRPAAALGRTAHRSEENSAKGDALWRRPQSRWFWRGLFSRRQGRQALPRCKSSLSQRLSSAPLTATSWTLDGAGVGATAGGEDIAAGAGATGGDGFAAANPSAGSRRNRMNVDRVAGERRPANVANVFPVKAAGAVHRRSIVPRDEVAHAPAMAVDESRLRRMLGEVAQQHARFRQRPSHDRASMRGQKQGFAARLRIGSHEAVTDGAEMLALFGREFGEADRLSRIDQRVLAHEILDLRLRLIVERIVGGAHVGELRLAAAGGNRPPREQGIFRRDRPVGAVGVPQAIGELEQPDPVLGRHDRALAREVGEIGDAPAEALLLALADVAGRLVALELAKVFGEGDLLLVGEVLAVKDDDRMPLHRGVDGADVGFAEGRGAVDPADLARECAGN